jgi:hypothetical protein
MFQEGFASRADIAFAARYFIEKLIQGWFAYKITGKELRFIRFINPDTNILPSNAASIISLSVDMSFYSYTLSKYLFA